MKVPSFGERIARRIEINESGCWNWTGYLNDRGYGSISVNHKGMRAHRATYEHFKGPIPEGLVIDHLCRNRRCVNPLHLEAVTQDENNRRSLSVTAANAEKTHCHQGHPLSGDNVYVWKRMRHCRECVRGRNRAWRAKNRRIGASA